MKKHFIAIAPKGKEFFFNLNSMILVPDKSALKIASLLTANNYKLKPDEVWHVYDNDEYYNSYISREIRQYRKGNNIKVYAYYG